MKRYFTVIIFCFVFVCQGLAQTNQLTLTRVAQMPDLPSPFEMRDWKDVAVKYDQLVYYGTSGDYFPLVRLSGNGNNYPSIVPIFMQTFVGSSTDQAEGINIIPSIVGASLNGVNKSNQLGTNWVEKSKDFFNSKNNQNVYLNNYSTISGNDWWYDVMPNIFFYQLYTLYPSTSGYNAQFTSVADRWLAAVHAMGGSNNPWTMASMNYRAWKLASMTGLTTGVKEPEAAGGIGWLLYHAYLETGEKKYLDGAQMSLEYLNSLTSNPSYELQLPYGAFVAAKMNAEQGTAYNMTKILNWCFDRGPLRGWGAIKGQWDGKDVSGLIGEANDGGNDYAFALNGFQQAAALVPVIKYDKRFARDLAKWTLNVANASRFFYRPFPTTQDDLTWSTANDPNAVIAYEALKEKDSHNANRPLNATGDAKRSGWAPTNLGLYGSSSVGYLAAVMTTTDVPGILLLDLNKTDFFQSDSYPTYALYNPHTNDRLVTLNLPAGSYDVYDAISETILATGVSGTTQITVKTDEAIVLTYIPAGTTLVSDNGKLYANNKIVDYYYGYDFAPKVRIKTLLTDVTIVARGQEVPVYLKIDNAGSTVSYSWSDDEGDQGNFTVPDFTWTAPTVLGENTLVVEVSSNGHTTRDSIIFNVVEQVPQAPEIQSIVTEGLWQATSSQETFTVNLTDADDEINELTIVWSSTGGTFSGQSGTTTTWQAPANEGIYVVTCKVTDPAGLSAEKTLSVLVKRINTGSETPAFAYYPFDGNVRDYSGNNRNATLVNVDETTDARGEAGKAYLFNSGSDLISLANDASLNFVDKITLSFWVKATNITEEAFILSHGSWEQRWKVSINPDRRLRWTVKTASATVDLDTSIPLTLNQYYHFTVVYSGYSLEIYRDGELESYKVLSGAMGTTTNSLTFGRKDSSTASYFLPGALDEVRIYNAIVPPDEISTLKDKWNEVVTDTENPLKNVQVYPNPAKGEFYLSNTTLAQVNNLTLLDVTGKPVAIEVTQIAERVKISVASGTQGVFILKLRSGENQLLRKIILK